MALNNPTPLLHLDAEWRVPAVMLPISALLPGYICEAAFRHRYRRAVVTIPLFAMRVLFGIIAYQPLPCDYLHSRQPYRQ